MKPSKTPSVQILLLLFCPFIGSLCERSLRKIPENKIGIILSLTFQMISSYQNWFTCLFFLLFLNDISLQNEYQYGSPQIHFLLSFVNCQDILGKKMKWFPATFSMVWNLKLSLDWLPPKAREPSLLCYLTHKKWFMFFPQSSIAKWIEKNTQFLFNKQLILTCIQVA